MKKAIITGITGQDGSYLADLLLEKGYEVHGIVRRASTFNRKRIKHLWQDGENHTKNLFLHYGDLGDSSSLFSLIMKIKPDEVYNLAAQSHVQISFEMPEYTADITGTGTVRLLEAIRMSGLPIKFYQASSSEMYGKVLETPQTETTPFYPRSPYGCAKVYSYYITKNYRESYGMYAVNGILFNHESPRRGKNFVTRKITHSIASILAGTQEKLLLGNLDAKRDWGYAKEYIEGMYLMLQQTTPNDYVLATGKMATVREFLEICLNHAGINWSTSGTGEKEQYINTDTGKVIVGIDPKYYRPAEVDLLIGDATKAAYELGWKAKTSLEELAHIMLDHDIALLQAS